MKRTILFLVAGIIAAQSFSQTQKGYWMLGTYVGSSGFVSNNSKTKYSNSATEYNSNGKSFGLNVGPSALYFIKDNLAIGAGVSVGFSSGKSKYSNTASANVQESKSGSTSLSFGPQVRAYFGKTGSKGQPWVEGSANLSTNPGDSKSSNTMLPNTSETDSRSNNWNAGGNIGYSHFLSSLVALQYYIGYRHYHYSGNSDYKPNPGAPYSYETTTNSDNINFGVGLQIHLPSKAVKK